MKKRYLLFLLVLFSCSINNSNKKIEYIEITNKHLIKNVNDYSNYCNQLDIDEAKFPLVIMLSTKHKKDSSLLELYYEMNLSSLEESLPRYYSIIGGRCVFMWRKPLKSKLISKNNIDSLFKKIFKRQYEHYLKYGGPPAPITYNCEKWIFVNNKLVKKELY